MNSTTDYLYLGLDETFAGVKFEFQTRGSNYGLKVEYYNGAWVELTSNLNSLVEDTSGFESDGNISWDIPTDWVVYSVNSANRYWIRISTTSVPVTVAKAYYIVPSNSVISLLALSSSQILNEEWKWCSYGSSIYVTIRNAGVTAYEGLSYITSSSSAANKQNFFIYNHEFLSNYQDSTYDSVITKTEDYIMLGDEGIIIVDASVMPSGQSTITVTLPTSYGSKGKEVTIKILDIESACSVTIEGASSEMIDGVANKVITTDYSCITLFSGGAGNWYIKNLYTP
jgi:hypothetical protein